VIGWVNVLGRGGELTVDPGFVSGRRPTEGAFQNAFEMEAERLRYFLSARTDHAAPSASVREKDPDAITAAGSVEPLIRKGKWV
jgi:hypothetical protein